MNIELSNYDTQSSGGINGNFYNLLQRLETSIPIQSLFVVKFDIPPILSEKLHNKLGEYSTSDATNIDKVIELFNDPSVSQKFGFALCHGIKIPGEKNITEKKGNEVNGYLPLSVVKSRNFEYDGVSIDVLESVVSLTDFVFKPWIRLCSRYGNFSDTPLSTNIEAICLERSTTNGSFNFFESNKPLIRKQYTFYNCIPTGVTEGKTLLYGDGENSISKHGVTWKFERYRIKLPTI